MPTPRRGMRALRNTGLALILAGAVALGFAAYAAFVSGTSEQVAQRRLLGAFGERLAYVAETHQEADPNEGDPVAVLEADTIGMRQVVVSGTTPAVLRLGPGHFRNTPLPGQPGNSVVAGRRNTYGAPFARIGDLSAGDELVVTTTAGEFRYEVEGEARTVSPGDEDVLSQTFENTLTLTSANPPWRGGARLAVRAKLASRNLAPAPRDGQVVEVGYEEMAISGEPAWVPVILTGLLLAGTLWGTVVLYRTWRRWPTWLLTTPVVLMCAILFYGQLIRLFPATV